MEYPSNGDIAGIGGYAQDGVPDWVGQEGCVGEDVFCCGDSRPHLVCDDEIPLSSCQGVGEGTYNVGEEGGETCDKN